LPDINSSGRISTVRAGYQQFGGPEYQTQEPFARKSVDLAYVIEQHSAHRRSTENVAMTKTWATSTTKTGATTKTWLAATAAVTLMTGVAMAETTTSTTTTERTVAPVPVPGYVAPVPVPGAPVLGYVAPAPAPVTETMTERTLDSNGVVHSKTTTMGTAVSPYGDTTTRKVATETTTVR
jgi:hypothetical protein